MEWAVIAVLAALVLLAGAVLVRMGSRRDPAAGQTAEELHRLLERQSGELDRLAQMLREELARNRGELGEGMAAERAALDRFGERLEQSQRASREELLRLLQIQQQATETRLAAMREALDLKLRELGEANAKKLEEMRRTVDEKLQSSVEKHFNESFKLISERLELVHKGLGEMQTLATGVGDLKKVLTNVKCRGNLGEIQLAAILEQSLSPEQYLTNVAVRNGSSERVEFAVRMPGRHEDDAVVLLPIDSKFPMEDYQRLLEAGDRSPEELRKARKALESAVRKCAQDIHDKYINPPVTTDFAVLFVPTEGLYAEILRLPGCFERLQHEWKIAVVGPSNLLAFLNSLQMGFRTLAIEKRSSEVWTILGAVKTEFGKFGDLLDKTRNKLESAVREIDNVGVRSRAIHRKLRAVQELPAADAAPLLEVAAENGEADEENA